METPENKLQQALQRFAVRKGLASASSLRFRAALIDMDGTLYDSMGHHTLAWHKMISDLGIEADRNRFYLFEGMTGKATVNLLFREYLHRDATDEEVAELYHRKTVYFNEMTPVKPMPGAAQLLTTLSDAGVTCVLVTGSGQRSLIDRLERDFPGIFKPELMITSADVEHGKPDPEPYLKAMQRAGVTAAEAMVVENAPLGVRAGAQSGAFTFGLTTGPVPVSALADEGADIVLPSMQALADLAPQLPLAGK
ncbi:MAG: HAD-IA family hydrolase [Barnesiella sp.]|nr:HAD-IA family hydrolase [Barnesiella sp.]